MACGVRMDVILVLILSLMPMSEPENGGLRFEGGDAIFSIDIEPHAGFRAVDCMCNSIFLIYLDSMSYTQSPLRHAPVSNPYHLLSTA